MKRHDIGTHEARTYTKVEDSANEMEFCCHGGDFFSEDEIRKLQRLLRERYGDPSIEAILAGLRELVHAEIISESRAAEIAGVRIEALRACDATSHQEWHMRALMAEARVKELEARHEDDGLPPTISAEDWQKGTR